MSNPQQDEFQALLARARAGCPDAARELHERYSDPIRRMVRRRLHQRMRSQYDSVDFLQDVWASFFHTSLEKYAFATPAALVAFLAELAQNKVVDEGRRRLQGHKYNLNGERSLAGSGRDDKEKSLDPPHRGPTPSQVAIAKEQWERLVDGQPDPYRLMLEMLRLGHTHLEIAEKTGLHPKMIQRLIQKMAKTRNLP